jgi:hypothetical protein
MDGPVHTLRHPILSHEAARAFFLGQRAQVPRFSDRDTAKVGFGNSLLRRYAGRPRRPLAEPVLEVVARETCLRERTFECGTLLARWRRDHPDSEALATLLQELRGEWPNLAVIQEEYLESLSMLFGQSQLIELDDASSLARAIKISTKYLNHYYYGVPFDRQILVEAWKRCRAENCDEAREKLELRLGPVDEGIIAQRRERAERRRTSGAQAEERKR